MDSFAQKVAGLRLTDIGRVGSRACDETLGPGLTEHGTIIVAKHGDIGR